MGQGGRGPNSHYTYEVAGVFLDDGVPCLLLLSRDGSLHTQLAVHAQIKEEE
jgi:hypothetical protein